MIIAITGTPCVGKTTVSEILAKKIDYGLVSFNELAEKYDSIVGHDNEMDAGIVDIERLKKNFEQLKGNKIIDGHLSHELPVDLVVVLRCNPRTLETRLINKYPENEKKIKENVESEILGVITSEAINSNENVCEIDVTGKRTKDVIKEIMDLIESDFKGQKIFVDWTEEFEDWLI